MPLLTELNQNNTDDYKDSTPDGAVKKSANIYPHIERLNIGPVSTMKISWDQPHEGNMFEFLWQRRSIERAW